MKKANTFSFCKRLRSFKYAWQGIISTVQQEHNARIHLLASILVIALSIYVGLSRWEWVAIVACICSVWAAELINTAIEALCNRISTEQHPLIKCAKDCAAGAVLMLSLAALCIGFLIFLPHLLP